MSVNKTKSFKKIAEKCVAIAVCTRNRNPDKDEYHRGVIVPFKNILMNIEEWENEDLKPMASDIKSVIETLKSIMSVKKIPHDEQVERLNQLFDGTDSRHLLT